MLVCVNYYWELDINSIQSVYETESIHDLILDIETSIKMHDGSLYFWEEDGYRISALRVEPYQDGYLLFDLATMISRRRLGYGSQLVRSVLSEYRMKNKPIYVHIEKKNAVSLSLHKNLGFQICNDYGKLIDGTISHRYYTLVYK